MSLRNDPRLDEAKAMDIAGIADRLGIAGLRRTGAELVGPCPVCGGRDRFGINVQKAMFLCRVCNAKGDGVALVRHVLGVDFKGALSWLCGDDLALVDPKEMEARRDKARAEQRRRDAYSDKMRRRAVADARAIWDTALPADGTAVRSYLALRGIAGPVLDSLPRGLRFAPRLKYIRKGAPDYCGPAMVAAIWDAQGQLAAVHQTWIDLDQPSGKALLTDPATGETLPAKLVRGSKKGGAIRLGGLSIDATFGPDVLVMGEGIETTLSALCADPVPNAAYWAGVDLGNMAGRMRRVPGTRYSGVPDLGDDGDGFVPPAWVRRLIFIMDGDSDPAATRAKCQCGLQRALARRPGLKAELVAAAPGQDLNDMLRGPQ